MPTNNNSIPLRSLLLWLALGSLVGLKFADWDQASALCLTHRSILTHGVLAPLLFTAWIASRPRARNRCFRWCLLGFTVANAVHLSFDLFPRSWWRHALIHIPGYGWTSPLFSIVWLGLSIVACLLLSLRLVRSKAELVLGLLALLASYSVSALWEPHLALRAFAVLAFAILSVSLLPKRG